MAAVIGALRVVLGIDTAAFQDGLKQAQSRLAAAGKSMQSAGEVMTARVTAPLAAAAAAIGLGVTQVAGNLVELGNQAKLANTGIETFQKWSYAAKTVGIEQDKLADILKDVNDKVGDFLATGGGEMKAFFDTIAPKVGITADAFRGLSGADALQLYVSSLEKAGVSQAEMTYYMEAIADEASALVPLLAESGAEMTRQGEAAAKFGLTSEKSVESARKFREAMQGLTQAMSALGTSLVEAGVLDFLTGFAERVTGWVAALNQANPQLTKFVLIGGGIAAALGPALVALGLAATAIGAIGAPVALVVAGIGLLAAAAVTLYANWDRIQAQFPAIAGVVESLGAAISRIVEGSLAHFQLMLQGVEQLLTGDFQAALETGKQIVLNFGQTIVDTLGALPAKFAQIGKDILSGLLGGLKAGWESVSGWLSGAADGIAQAFRDRLGIQSPSTVFAEIGGHIMQGLRQGLGAETGGIKAEMESFAQGLGQIFAGVLLKKQDLGDSLKDFGLQTLGSLGGGLLNKGFGGLATALKIPGFANGTRNAPPGLAWVGERGKELVRFRGGEQVTPHRESLDLLRGGRATDRQDIRVFVDQDGNWQAAVGRIAGQQVEARRGQIVGDSVQAMRQGNAMSGRFMGSR